MTRTTISQNCGCREVECESLAGSVSTAWSHFLRGPARPTRAFASAGQRCVHVPVVWGGATQVPPAWHRVEPPVWVRPRPAGSLSRFASKTAAPGPAPGAQSPRFPEPHTQRVRGRVKRGRIHAPLRGRSHEGVRAVQPLTAAHNCRSSKHGTPRGPARKGRRSRAALQPRTWKWRNAGPPISPPGAGRTCFPVKGAFLETSTAGHTDARAAFRTPSTHCTAYRRTGGTPQPRTSRAWRA